MSDLEGFGFVMPHWLYWGWLAVMPLIMIYLDRRSPESPSPVSEAEQNVEKLLLEEDPLEKFKDVSTPVTRVIDWISEHSGVFVAFWTVNAVCFYFFEVVMRYLFNMPTIWVHESSYLMLGMQYLMAGSYAMLHGAHVRVDVVYNKLPIRGRVGMDIFTSLFFFIFALALAGTSWTFFLDSFNMKETTVETWGIQYWPVKGMMFVGSSLILLAGISKLIKDIIVFIRLGQEARS
ncbi:TRAP transporter small permease subunit [Aestuariirhabdus litorea]|uniref:TRAP transporter small permease protein n=1 Tax=Aestuariirhabdus litorea TaxID=2528527 RepID=A0A3P3VI87_9GAMM|nr:TRAP transporter small permease subunit [Aestuariirhabdus litorea]RRJ82440.1 TRAP transporter small permease subunit [Aestuariirhabdus litorea]RWW92603.1 TRAP transporter small permease subunit [Endozoicomonadaceae bacterium GTF-13]